MDLRLWEQIADHRLGYFVGFYVTSSLGDLKFDKHKRVLLTT